MIPTLRNTLLALLFTAITATAQRPEPQSKSFVQSVRPAFKIEPIVHRFTARRGELIPFKFEIGSLGKSMDVTIRPVALRQEESGVILHDESSNPAEDIQISSETEFHLSPGQTHTIEGVLTVPLAKTNYLSYGILVQDLGQDPSYQNIPGEKKRTQAGIRFVTQYVLRIDVATGVADLGELKHLRIDSGGVVAEKGLAQAKAYLTNPTDYAFECFVKASLNSAGGARARPFHLGMPSRASLSGDERYLIRIMPKSRLRLEAPVGDAIKPGEQILHVGLTNGRREIVSADFETNILPEVFPALRAKVAFAGDGISILPGQIKMGSIRGTRRMAGVKLVNHSSAEQTLFLAVESLTGQPMEEVRIAPAKVKLSPGKTKSVRLMVNRTTSEKLLSGRFVVRTGDATQPINGAAPLNVFNAEPEDIDLDIAPVSLVSSDGQIAFRSKVTNPSSIYVPLDAKLEIQDQTGRTSAMVSGYGVWLEPGGSQELEFNPSSTLAAGDYATRLTLNTFEGQRPIQNTLNMRIEARNPLANKKAGADASVSSSSKPPAVPEALSAVATR